MATSFELYIFGVAATAGLLRVIWSISYSFTPWLLPWDLWIFPSALLLAPLLCATVRRMTETQEDRIYLLSGPLRFSLAFMMFLYGLSKVLLEQFSQNFSDRDTRVLEASGVIKAWSFFGHSSSYQAFLGWGEILGALCLLFYAALPAGAILLSVMLLNIAYANFTHNIGVRANSSLYLCQALLLLWPERQRIWRFMLGLGTESRRLPAIRERRRALLNAARLAACAAIGAYASYNQWMYHIHKPFPHPLIGIWRSREPVELLRLRFDTNLTGSLATPTEERKEITFDFEPKTGKLTLQHQEQVFFRGTAQIKDGQILQLLDAAGKKTIYQRVAP